MVLVPVYGLCLFFFFFAQNRLFLKKEKRKKERKKGKRKKKKKRCACARVYSSLHSETFCASILPWYSIRLSLVLSYPFVVRPFISVRVDCPFLHTSPTTCRSPYGFAGSTQTSFFMGCTPYSKEITYPWKNAEVCLEFPFSIDKINKQKRLWCI